MPVRHRKKSATSYLGWVHVPVAGRPIRHESTLERDFLHWMPFVASLIRIEEQPVCVCDQGHKYTPDFNLELRDNQSRFRGIEYTHLVEVKPFRVLQRDWEKLQPRIQLGLEYARTKGWNFKVLTELEIRPTELPLIQFLRRFLQVEAPKDLTAWLLQQLAVQPLTLLDLLSRAKKILGLEPHQTLPTIWNLVATKMICLAAPPRLDYQIVLSHAETRNLGVWIPGERLTGILRDSWELRPLVHSHFSQPPPASVP